MPMSGREVGPARICQITHVTGKVDTELSPGLNKHNLEETTYISLVGCMRQLCDIATHADEIFTGLTDTALGIAKRSEKLHKRVEYVNDCLNTGSCIDGRSSGPDMITKEQSLMIRKTRPAAIKDRYEASEKIPPLQDFVDFVVDDTSIHPHQMYSDPALFVNAWLTLMDKEAQQFKKGKKRSFKKAKDNNLSKIATLKKKVHDPKSKTFTVVDVLPHYAPLPGRLAAPGVEMSHSATLNRKKYGTSARRLSSDIDPRLAVSPDSYTSPERQLSFDKGSYRISSTPIASPVPGDSHITSPSDVQLNTSVSDGGVTSCLDTSLPPPPADIMAPPPPPPPFSLPLPPAPPSQVADPVQLNSPPPFMPPPVPETAIIPRKMSEVQRVMRTNEVPKAKGRDTLLEMIRSSSFNLKPIALNPISTREEPTYATYTGTDVASILQRRKYLMGQGNRGESSGESSGDESSSEGWD